MGSSRNQGWHRQERQVGVRSPRMVCGGTLTKRDQVCGPSSGAYRR